MSLLDRARRDWRSHTTGDETAAVDITLQQEGSSPVSVRGIAMTHHLSQDEEGGAVNALNSHCTINEDLMVESGIIVRDDNEEVDLSNLRVSYKNSAGIEDNFIVKQWFPDETVGMIYMVLGKFKDE